MRAYVLLRGPDGGRYELGHGDLIGRLDRAELRLDDARISEAHAMVSLRGGGLHLLGLRGRFSLGSGPLSECTLEAGQRIQLTRALTLTVEAVELPERVLALEGDGLARQILSGTHSLVLDPLPSLVSGVRRDAEAVIWGNGERWRIQLPGSPAADLLPGEALSIAGRRFSACSVQLAVAGRHETHLRGRVEPPLRLVARFDTAHIHRDGEPVFVLKGLSAQLVSELVRFGGPVHWEMLSGELWGPQNRAVLRGRLDVTLNRLRNKLRAARIRPDLIRSTSTGYLELVLGRGDEIIDET